MSPTRHAPRGRFPLRARPALTVGVTSAACCLLVSAPAAHAANPCAAAQQLARAGLTSDAKTEYTKLLKSKRVPRCARIGVHKLAKREFETAGALLHAGYRAEAFKKIQDGLQLSATSSANVPLELRRFLIARRTFARARALDKDGFHEAAKGVLGDFVDRRPRIAGGLPADLRPLVEPHSRGLLHRVATWLEDETDNGKALLRILKIFALIFVIALGAYLILHELIRRLRRYKKHRVTISPFSGDGDTDDDLAKGFALELQAKVDTIGVEMGGKRPDLALPTPPTTTLPASVTTAFPQLKYVDAVNELIDRLIPSKDRSLTGHLHSSTAHGVGASLVLARADNGRIMSQVMLRQGDYGPGSANGSDDAAAYEDLIPPAVYWFREVSSKPDLDDDAPWQAHALFAAGARLHEAGNLASARRLYTESLKYSPPIPEVLINLGGIEIREGSGDPLDLYEIERGVAHITQGIDLQ
jgi:tetratricopeptide (TPR) repeat protein